MKVKLIVWILLFALAIGLVASYIIAGNLFRTSYSSVSSPPKSLRANRISFPGKTGQSLSGWFAKGDDTKGGVLLMHRLRSNRLEMLNRAIFLNTVGYSVLLFDFRGHGESPGDYPRILLVQAPFGIVALNLPT